MSFILYLVAGFFSGVLGGMGMGGGTVLIPVLTLVLGVEQHVAQAANLLAFLPMSLFALGVHKKNGLIKTRGLAFIIIPAVVTSALAGLAASFLSGEVLKRLFGLFLCALAIKLLRDEIISSKQKSALGDKPL